MQNRVSESGMQPRFIEVFPRLISAKRVERRGWLRNENWKKRRASLHRRLFAKGCRPCPCIINAMYIDFVCRGSVNSFPSPASAETRTALIETNRSEVRGGFSLTPSSTPARSISRRGAKGKRSSWKPLNCPQDDFLMEFESLSLDNGIRFGRTTRAPSALPMVIAYGTWMLRYRNFKDSNIAIFQFWRDGLNEC